MSREGPREWRSVRVRERNDQVMDYMSKLKQSMVRPTVRSDEKTCLESKSLMHFNDNRVFIWQSIDQCVYCFALKDETIVTNIQVLVLTNAPLFEVESIELCGTGRYLAVWGSRGINIVELPPKWGINGVYEGGKDSVITRSWALDQRFFVCNQNIDLLCVGWHPNSPQHIVLLTSDNSLRIFYIKDEEIPIQTIDLSTSDANHSVNQFGVSAFAKSLGDNAVSFDFGPSISKCYDIEPSTVDSCDECLTPIYILRGNGDVLLIYSSLKYSYVSNTVFGPLTMRPPAEDNYGVDACSIACLDCVPPLIVIATSFGVVHHCIALDVEDQSDSKHSLLPQPTLYVYETIELSLTLTSNTGIEDISCALRLTKDRMIPMRYFCSHSCGLHVISVPFVSQLKSKEDLNFREEESIVDHLICTKPLGASDSDTSGSVAIIPVGIGVGVQNGYTFVIVMFSDGELLCRRLTTSYIAHLFDDEVIAGDMKTNTLSDISVPKIDFNEYIKQLLKRNTTVPLIKSNEAASNEWSQNLALLLTTTDILKTEYIKKYELVSKAIEKRSKVLSNDKQIQTKELNKCLNEKDLVLQSLLDFVDKYDKTRERQELLSNRIDKVLESLQFQRPELSDAEIQLSDELKRVSQRLTAHKNKLEQIKVKCKYQSQHPPTTQTNGQSVDIKSTPTAIPTPNQIKSIRQMLANQGQLIEGMVESVNNFTKNGFQ